MLQNIPHWDFSPLLLVLGSHSQGSKFPLGGLSKKSSKDLLGAALALPNGLDLRENPWPGWGSSGERLGRSGQVRWG